MMHRFSAGLEGRWFNLLGLTFNDRANLSNRSTFSAWSADTLIDLIMSIPTDSSSSADLLTMLTL
jgi:hypothetical protein